MAEKDKQDRNEEELLEEFALSQEEEFEKLWEHTLPVLKTRESINAINLNSPEIIEALKKIVFVFYCSGVGSGLEKGVQQNFGFDDGRN